jgi:hypothetical protein
MVFTSSNKNHVISAIICKKLFGIELIDSLYFQALIKQ